ncbi:MAG: hypothetical protein Q4G68_12395 [Planctomycetia bacterium]|nr:hypothetical protein [Planctomycetia bacterium]
MFVLLPCYSLEDFSFYMTANDTQEVFASWTALFHPALLKASGQLPRWETASAPNALFKRKLVIVPPGCESKVPADWLAKMEEERIPLVRGLRTREELLAAALDALNLDDPGFDQDLVDSYYAVGFAYFLEDLISRKFRYMSDIDTNRLEKFFLDSLNALESDGASAAIDGLQKACDLLCQTNEYYIPSPGRFVNLTRLETENDLGHPLQEQLLTRRRRDEKTNLFLKPDWLPVLAERYPQSLSLIREERDAGRLFLIGTEFGPKPMFLMTQTEIVAELHRAQQAYTQYLGRPATCYGREKAGFTQVLPPLLKLTGFETSLLFSLDGWLPDKEKQSRIDWVSRSGSMIPSLCRNPVDGEDHRAFLRMLEGCGYSYRTDDLGTVIWSHRPGHEVPWWSDIVRINRFVPLIGETMGMAEFFKLTETAGHRRSYGKDMFRTNALTRAAQEEQINPVTHAYSTCSTLFRTTKRAEPERSEPDTTGEPTTGEKSASSHLKQSYSYGQGSLWQRLRSFIAGRQESADQHEVAGYTEERLSRTEVDKYYTLSNEFFQIRVDPTTGAVKRLSTWDPGQVQLSRGLLRLPGRGNRFSWLPGYRLSSKERDADGRTPQDGHYGYAVPAVDRIEVVNDGENAGTLQIAGRFVLPSGKTAGQFQHKITAYRGNRVLDVELTFQPKIKPKDHAWENYYGCRFAWRDELARIAIGVHEQTWETERDYLQAPEMVDIRSEDKLGITLLTNGNPFFRRFGMKRMDLVLIPKNEQGRTFRFGVGVDLPHPLREALTYKTRAENEHLGQTESHPALPVRVDSENGTVLAALPLPGYNAGVGSLLVQETFGLHTNAVLTFGPKVSCVRRTVLAGQAEPKELTLVEGAVTFPMTPYETVLLEVTQQ